MASLGDEGRGPAAGWNGRTRWRWSSFWDGIDGSVAALEQAKTRLLLGFGDLRGQAEESDGIVHGCRCKCRFVSSGCACGTTSDGGNDR
jgi:hypothetical protein